MRTKHLCVLIHIRIKGEVGKPSFIFTELSQLFMLAVIIHILYCRGWCSLLSCV